MITLDSLTLLEINTDLGKLVACRPDADMAARTKDIAKEIFIEAFATTYTEYHGNSKSPQSIEVWLQLKEGLTLTKWLSNVFDDEYAEYETGDKQFIHLYSQDKLIAWLSHSPISKAGDVYLSQCSLEAKSRNHKVATTAFSKALQEDCIQKIFPGVKEVKLITRKVNDLATRLYTKAGFTQDLTIDPSIYGESYDDRYMGFRLSLK